jgi:DNA mismatch repair protein MutL
MAATRIVVQDGKIYEVGEVGSPPGTRVVVNDLFYNLPGRQKFLKSVRTELAHCVEAVMRMALRYCSVGFTVRHNGRVLMDLPPAEQQDMRLRSIFGKQIGSEMLPVAGGQEDIQITGWVTSPTVVRGSPKGIYTYVNGRFVRDKVIAHAISESYRTLIPSRSYPVTVLSLSVPSLSVDVNVHPTKMEVRFRDSTLIYRVVFDTLRQALGSSDVSVSVGDNVDMTMVHDASAVYEKSPPLTTGVLSSLPQWRVAHQLGDTYIVLEAEDGMTVIDQHALHERLLFDRLSRARRGVTVPRQRLLIPRVIEMRPEDADALSNCQEDLAASGFEVETFGQGSIVVKAVPSFLAENDLTSILDSVSQAVTNSAKGVTTADRSERILTCLACQGAVRANRKLQDREIDSLLRQWEEAGRPSTCPHGRPLAVTWTWRDIEGWFKRR